MGLLMKIFSESGADGLTPDQRRMYASEKLDNFRWIFQLLASKSARTLTHSDLAPPELHRELENIGQYAELAYSIFPFEFAFENLSYLVGNDFPLEGYDALLGAVLVSSFRGTVADLPGYVAYRPSGRSLIVAIAGTATLKQALYDIRAFKRPHPAGKGCTVHAGFWTLYGGIKSLAISAIEKGLREQDVDELILTGHSMGGALSYLLALDLVVEGDVLQPGLPLTLVVSGCPRIGNEQLASHWRQVMNIYRLDHGPESIKEYSVKGYNDGVPSLPPASFGYRHISQNPYYFTAGRLYKVPSNEPENALFSVLPDESDRDYEPPHPRGGHNYYYGRDMEKSFRRMAWLKKVNVDNEGWQVRYRELVRLRERSD